MCVATDLKERIKDKLDRACLEKLHLKKDEQCIHRPTYIADTDHLRHYTTSPYCWRCHENDALTQEIADEANRT